MASGDILDLSSSLFYSDNVFDDICDGLTFFSADEPKLFCTFWPSLLCYTFNSVSQGLPLFNSWVKDWMMEFCAERCSIIGWHIFVKQGELKGDNHIALINCLVRNLGQNRSCTVNVPENALTPIAKATKEMRLPHESLGLWQSNSHLFKTRARPILDYVLWSLPIWVRQSGIRKHPACLYQAAHWLPFQTELHGNLWSASLVLFVAPKHESRFDALR